MLIIRTLNLISVQSTYLKVLTSSSSYREKITDVANLKVLCHVNRWFIQTIALFSF